MQNEPAGKEFPLSEFAAKMISISDNTATDHLLTRRSGQCRKVHGGVQLLRRATCRSSGRWRCSDQTGARLTLAARFAAADERRAKVHARGPKWQRRLPDLAFAEKWTVPIEIERVRVVLFGRRSVQGDGPAARDGGPVGMAELVRVLRINGGIPFDRKMWVSVAYKGGSRAS